MRWTRKRRGVWTAAALAAVATGPAAIAGTTFTWNGGSGDFQSANWTLSDDADTGGDPLWPNDTNDRAVINAGGPMTITLTGNATTGGTSGAAGSGVSLSVQGVNLTLDLAGFTYSALPLNNAWAGAIRTVTIGTAPGESATMLVSSSVAGGVIRNSNSTSGSGTAVTTVGTASGTAENRVNSFLTLDDSLGFGVTWLNEGNFEVHGSSAAENDQSILTVGAGATLTIFRGGLVTRNAIVTVKDGGTVTSSLTQIGDSGSPVNNSLTILNIDGLNGASTFTHNGASTLVIGESGSTRVNVTNGGVFNMTAGAAQIANTTTSGNNVVINLTGDGSRMSLRSTIIGGISGEARGPVALNIGAGAIFQMTQSDGMLRAWDRVTVTLTGGTVEMAAGDASGTNFELRGNGTTNFGTLRGVGRIQRLSGSVFYNLLNTSGHVRPGDTTGTPAIGTIQVIDGNFVQAAAGASFFEFNQTQNDLLAITGDATIDGSVTFAILDGYAFVVGENNHKRWNFVTASSISYDATDNISTLMAGFVEGFHYTFGVVDLEGGGQALQLHWLPEPASAAALLMAGALAWPRRRSARARADVA